MVIIRHPNEIELKPLKVDNNDILTIPFYKLSTAFENLEQHRPYFLYCDKGVMSELHASHLKESGYANVNVYRPEKVWKNVQ